MRMDDLCASMRHSHLRATASADGEFSAPDANRDEFRPERARYLSAWMTALMTLRATERKGKRKTVPEGTA